MAIDITIQDSEVEAEVNGYGQGVALQIDGNDLVHINEIDTEQGTATLTVFMSTAETAPVLWTGTVDLVGHFR